MVLAPDCSDDSTQHHVDRSGEEGGSEQDENVLNAVWHHFPCLVISGSSGAVTYEFDWIGQLCHHSAEEHENIQKPPKGKADAEPSFQFPYLPDMECCCYEEEYDEDNRGRPRGHILPEVEAFI